MQKLLIAFAVLALMVVATQAQENHNPLYYFGGYYTTSTSTLYAQGIYQYDKTGSTPTVTLVFPKSSMPYSTYVGSMDMDWNNKDLIIQTAGTSSTLYPGGGIFRLNLATGTYSTIFRIPPTPSPTYVYGYPQYGAVVDQNGDYLFSYYQYQNITTPTTIRRSDYYVMHCDRLTGAVSTLLTSMTLGRRAYFNRHGRDIDSGKAMFMDTVYLSSPSTIRYPVLTLNPEDGYNAANAGTWNDGSVYGWVNRYDPLEQNHRNGNLEGPYYNQGYVYQLTPGSAGFTTIATVSTTSLPYRYVYCYDGGYDLQTAGKPRYIANGYYTTTGAHLIYWDVGTWTVTGFDTMMARGAPYTYNYNYHFAFQGGRHIQTILTAPGKWDIRVSIPHLPAKAYAMAAGASGVRPGIALPDGRNINLNFDVVTYMTVNNLLPGIWSPGSGTLDANGEAVGGLNISSLPVPSGGFGIPLWIAVAVLDAKAPSGIAYVTDTYVMRI